MELQVHKRKCFTSRETLQRSPAHFLHHYFGKTHQVLLGTVHLLKQRATTYNPTPFRGLSPSLGTAFVVHTHFSGSNPPCPISNIPSSAQAAPSRLGVTRAWPPHCCSPGRGLRGTARAGLAGCLLQAPSLGPGAVVPKCTERSCPVSVGGWQDSCWELNLGTDL